MVGFALKELTMGLEKGRFFNRQAPPPTEEQARASNALEYGGSTRTVEKIGGSKWLRGFAVLGGATTVVGGTGAVLHETVPAIHRAVDSAFLDPIKDKLFSPAGATQPTESSSPIETVSEVFDNTAKSTSFGEKNTHFISQEQARELNLDRVVINKDEGTIEHILPFKMSKGTTGTIERIDLRPQINPNVRDLSKLPQPPIEPINLKFDKIVTIVAPENAYVYLIKGNPEWGENPNFAGRVRIYKYYKEADITVVWNFSDGGITTKRYPFNPLLSMKDFDKEIGRGTNYEKLPVVDALTEVATTSEPNQPITLVIMTYRGAVVGPEAEIAGYDFLLKSKFKTDENGQLIAIELEN